MTEEASPASAVGMRIIDFTHAAAGPLATMVLADFGAEVWKVEKPNRGEHARHAAAGGGSSDFHIGGYRFFSLNRNKRSVAIDISTREGAELVRGLVASSDVLVENFRPGVMEKLGLGYEELKEINPRIVYCKISGFGSEGPLAGDAGMDIVAQARAGTIAITGEPGGPPIKPGPAIADLGAGLQAVIGILMALRSRDRTGSGQKVEVSLVDAALLMLSNYGASVLNSDIEMKPMGRGHPQLAPYQGFEASDGWVFVGCGTNRLWRLLCDVIGQAELSRREEFATNPARVEHRDALEAELAPIFAGRGVAEWVATLRSAGIPAAPILSPRQGFDERAAAGYPIVQTVEHPDLGTVRLPGISILLSETPGGARRYPPRLGEHTREILETVLQTDPGEVDRLEEAGIVEHYQLTNGEGLGRWAESASPGQAIVPEGP